MYVAIEKEAITFGGASEYNMLHIYTVCRLKALELGLCNQLDYAIKQL